MSLRIWIILIVPFFISSCASIVGSKTELININSHPEAKVMIKDENGEIVFKGTTPTSVNLKKSDGYFSGKDYTVIVGKKGFERRHLTISSGPNGWYLAGNLLFGSFIGWLVVDPLTGAMWSLDPDRINIHLEKIENSPQSRLDKNEIQVSLLSDIPPELRKYLIRQN